VPEFVNGSFDGHVVEFGESGPAGRIEERAFDDGDSNVSLFVACEDLGSFDGAFPTFEFAGEEGFGSEC
jgi:hypothetical protein